MIPRTSAGYASPSRSPSAQSHVFPPSLTVSPSSKLEDRPFKCVEPGCFQRFKRKFTLTEHTKTHTGERPFVCPVQSCSKSFVTSGNLSRRKRLHSWLKPQTCHVAGCGRAFVNEAKRERHLLIHLKGSHAVSVDASTIIGGNSIHLVIQARSSASRTLGPVGRSLSGFDPLMGDSSPGL